MTSRVAMLCSGLGALLALAACKEDLGPDPTASCGPPTEEAPADLACTGLYTSFRSKTLAPGARAFAPGFSLWSDGYDKSRFIELPAGAQIDATAVDDWRFPVGTKVWKEFRDGDRRIETRLLWKQREDRWVQAAYVWSEDGATATRGEGQSLTINGKPYTVPELGQCDDCHFGRKDKLLGFEALSLALPDASGVTLAALVAENRVAPPPARTTASLPHPGLGVLHVNCGVSCHNTTPGAKGSDASLDMRLGFDEVATKPTEAWALFSTSVGVPAELPGYDGSLRIAPGAPDKSAIVASMKTRLTGQMPPLATLEVDLEGVAAVESWVRTLPPSP